MTVAITGTEATFQRAAERILPGDFAAAARAHLAQRLPEGAGAEVTLERPAGEVAITADESDPYQLLAEPLVSTVWGEVPYRVRIMRGERELRRTMLVFRVSVIAEIPVAAHDLPRGTVLELPMTWLFVANELSVPIGSGLTHA